MEKNPFITENTMAPQKAKAQQVAEQQQEALQLAGVQVQQAAEQQQTQQAEAVLNNGSIEVLVTGSEKLHNDAIEVLVNGSEQQQAQQAEAEAFHLQQMKRRVPFVPVNEPVGFLAAEQQQTQQAEAEAIQWAEEQPQAQAPEHFLEWFEETENIYNLYPHLRGFSF